MDCGFVSFRDTDAQNRSADPSMSVSLEATFHSFPLELLDYLTLTWRGTWQLSVESLDNIA
jgi:hypothetical protein